MSLKMSCLMFKTISPISQCTSMYRQRTSSISYIFKKTKILNWTDVVLLNNQRTLTKILQKSSSLYFCTSNQSPNVESLTMMEKLVNKMPNGVQPYLKLMRLDKPTGAFFLLWPCYWSLAMATPAGCLPDPILLAQFGLGTLLMRGAGCTINDLWDKDIDAKVSRTKSRPLASGDVSVLDAWMFLGGQLSLALLILLQFNWYSIVLGASSLFLVVGYPLVKRFWNWPQLVLGLTFNWGALLAWSVTHGTCYWPVVLPLYGACISWTLIYDTIYAHQDRVDDLLINIKSTAIKFGDQTKIWLSGFSVSATACFLGCGYVADQTWPYYVSVAIASSMFASQISTLDINNPKDCWQKFKSNKNVGWIIFAGIIGGTLLKKKENGTAQRPNRFIKDNFLDSSTLQLT